MAIGFAVRSLDEPIKMYVETLGRGTQWILPTTDWRMFHAWVMSRARRPLKTVVVTDMCYVPFLDYVKGRFGSKVVCLDMRDDGSVSWPDADANYTAYDFGWGVDKIRWQKEALFRDWHKYPVFYLTERHFELEGALIERGYRVASGDKNYSMGNVAIVPNRQYAPSSIYEAMASGMAVVTTRENERWLDGFPCFSTYLEDGVDAILGDVTGTDFKLLGMMAQETVPSVRDFREKLLGILA